MILGHNHPGGLPEPSENDDMLVQWLRDNHIGIAFVLTKADKFSRSQGTVARRKIGEHLGVRYDELLPFSAKTRSGRDDIWRVIETACLPQP